MSTFNPYALKPWFTKRMTTIIKFADKHNISPDVFTLVGVLGAVMGAIVFVFAPHMSWWLAGTLMFVFGLVIRLGGANLDGAVARTRGVSRPYGFVLNEIGDRASDFILFFGLYLASPVAWQPYVVLVTFVSAFPTLVSVSGAAVRVPRINGGPFGKTERSIFFVIAAIILAGGLPNLMENITFGVILTIFALGALATVVKRSKRIIAYVAQNGTDWVDDQPTIVKKGDSA